MSKTRQNENQPKDVEENKYVKLTQNEYVRRQAKAGENDEEREKQGESESMSEQ